MYNLIDFKKDIIKIRELLPKDLQNIKLNFVNYGNASFNNGITINFLGLKQNTELKKALEKYLNIKLTTKDFILACLLHEYGHFNRHILGLNDMRVYRQQTYFIDISNESYIKRQLNYWRQVTEEKEAWNFAKKYFKKINL